MKQAAMAVDFFGAKISGAEFDIIPLKTTGDKKLEWSLEKQGGKGLFTKELEDALLEGRADFAVHSAKDMPTALPEGLSLCAYLPRDEVNDILIIKEDVEIPSTIATGSPRRRAQLKRIFPNAGWTEIRGNVESRLNKIANENSADATLLSWAGLERLGIKSFPKLKFKKLDVCECVPAVGQGAIVIECRTSDAEFFGALGDPVTKLAVSLEREFLSALGGGCQVAYGAYFDGKFFHAFHENFAYKKLDFSGLTLGEMQARVQTLVKEDILSS